MKPADEGPKRGERMAELILLGQAGLRAELGLHAGSADPDGV